MALSLGDGEKDLTIPLGLTEERHFLLGLIIAFSLYSLEIVIS